MGVSPNLPPSAPPTSIPGPPPGPTQAWATALGVVAVIFGALGLPGAAWGVVGPRFQAALANPTDPVTRITVEVTQRWIVVSLSSAVLSALAAALLLAAGAGLLRRRAWTPGVCRVWAWCKIVPVVGTSAYAFLLQRELWSQIAQHNALANAPRGFLDPMAGIGGAATLVVGLLWGSALPVFMLIWLGPPKIRADLSGWR